MTAKTPAADQLTARLAQPPATLGVFLPAGFPAPGLDIEALSAFADAGAGVLEIGVPHHNPSLDGPDITEAYRRALHHGTQMRDVLATVSQAATITSASVVVMSYWSAVRQYGLRAFTQELAEAGAAGAMIPDLPLAGAGPWLTAARAAGLHTPQFAPRPSTDSELARICAAASGWIYAPAALGPTGFTGALDHAELERFTQRLRRATDVPVVTGVGVSTPELAAVVAPYVSGAVIGSPLVRPLLRRPDRTGIAAAADRVALFTDSLRTPALT